MKTFFENKINKSLRFLSATLVFSGLCGGFALAQTTDLNAQNPFATRAARTSDVSESRGTASPPIVPRAASSVDVVYLKNGARWNGVVEGISGRGGLAFRLADADGGEQKTILTAEIERVETNVGSEFRQGVAAFENGRRTGDSAEFRRALTSFQGARKSETRRWIKEWATAKIVESLVALGRDDDAANEFFLLCRLDAFSAFLPSIPLRWGNQTSLKSSILTQSPDARLQTEESAASWLDAKSNPSGVSNPMGSLLAASILLNSAKYKNDAVAALQALVVLEPTDESDVELAQTCRIVSLLATAQLWRLSLLKTPSEREVDRWTQTLALFPDDLRCGPTFLVAQGNAKLRRDDAASRAFLQVALLAPTNRGLAEQATDGAAKALERIRKTAEAQKIRADAQTRFGDR